MVLSGKSKSAVRFQWWSTLKRKEFAPRSKFFPLNVDPSLEELPLPEKQAGRHENYSVL